MDKLEMMDVYSLANHTNEMLYYMDCVEDGLKDRKRGKAAHTECMFFARSYIVVKALTGYLAFRYVIKDKGATCRSIESCLAADKVAPSYLDAFEAYLNCFGDKWFNTEINRDLFFNLLKKSFVEIVRVGMLLVDNPSLTNNKFRYSLGFFIQELEAAALEEDSSRRRLRMPEIIEMFRDIRKQIACLLEEIVKSENRFCLEQTRFKITPLDNSKWIQSSAAVARKRGEALLRLIGDRRPVHCPDDKRYLRIEYLASIWCRLSPSVAGFMECCKLLEQSALLASEEPYDCNLSSRDWIATLFEFLCHHPKEKGAKSIADLQFTDEERGQMSVVFKNMSLALLRYRRKIKQNNGKFRPDPDSYDMFVNALPGVLGPETRDYRALLFEEGDAESNDGYNSHPFVVLGQDAQTRYRALVYLKSSYLDTNLAEVERTIKKAFASGSRDLIERTYDELIRKCFPKRSRSLDVENDESEGLQEIIELSKGGSTLMPEPGKDFKQVDRFSYAPKYKTIIDMDHRDEPYHLAAYEGITASSAVEVIKILIKAIGKKDGWVKCRPNWRMIFKDGVYHRFKREQIQVGSRGNQHLGEWRLIPRTLFKELTLAKPSDAQTTPCVG